MQEVLKEKTLRIRTPGGVDRIIGIACRPTDNHCVIDADDDIGHHVPPADRLEPASEAAESQGRRTPVTVADGIIEQQQRDARRQKRDQIGQDERAAAVFKSNIGETPNIAQADGEPMAAIINARRVPNVARSFVLESDTLIPLELFIKNKPL